MDATQDLEKCEVQCVDVKSLESTRRKAIKFCGGDVRKIADMARVTVICETPEALQQAYLEIKRSLPVSRTCGFAGVSAILEEVPYNFAVCSLCTL